MSNDSPIDLSAFFDDIDPIDDGPSGLVCSFRKEAIRTNTIVERTSYGYCGSCNQHTNAIWQYFPDGRTCTYCEECGCIYDEQPMLKKELLDKYKNA